jgi:hypothetical protein
LAHLGSPWLTMEWLALAHLWLTWLTLLTLAHFGSPEWHIRGSSERFA